MSSSLIESKLRNCLEHINTIEIYFHEVRDFESFVNPKNKMVLDAIIMRLQALGETIKKITKNNPEVIIKLDYHFLNNIIRLRDYISHHYEQIESEIIFEICSTHIPVLKFKIQNHLQK